MNVSLLVCRSLAGAKPKDIVIIREKKRQKHEKKVDSRDSITMIRATPIPPWLKREAKTTA